MPLGAHRIVRGAFKKVFGMDIAQRHKNGQWATSGNPAGRPPSVFASQNDVADRLLQKYTPSEIIAIAGNPARLDQECSSFQAMILIQLANALSARDNNDNALERERLLDRVSGKPVSRTELTGKNGEPLQINVITGVGAVDAEFVEVVAPAIEDKREVELSSAEKLEARRAYNRERMSKKKAEAKAAGIKNPSFNDRLKPLIIDPEEEAEKRREAKRALAREGMQAIRDRRKAEKLSENQ